MMWVEHCRAGLAAVENSKRGKKARRGWRESVDVAEAESARREVEGA